MNLNNIPKEITDYYEILNKLGKGSYSEVYKIKSLKDNKYYCLKIINITEKNFSKNNNEILILKKLNNHPNIIKYINNYKTSNNLYIIFEFCEYSDFNHLIKNNIKEKIYINEDIIWEFSYQCLKGLEYLHNNNIIHRDIKLLNIFLTKDKVIKIGDLGMAKIITNKVINLYSRVGTPLYLPPELIKKENYDFKADIWSLGCSIYQLASLKPPFFDENLVILCKKIINEIPKRLPNVFSNDLNNFVFKLINKDKFNRPSAEEAIKLIPKGIRDRINNKLNYNNFYNKSNELNNHKKNNNNYPNIKNGGEGNNKNNFNINNNNNNINNIANNENNNNNIYYHSNNNMSVNTNYSSSGKISNQLYKNMTIQKYRSNKVNISQRLSFNFHNKFNFNNNTNNNFYLSNYKLINNNNSQNLFFDKNNINNSNNKFGKTSDLFNNIFSKKNNEDNKTDNTNNKEIKDENEDDSKNLPKKENELNNKNNSGSFNNIFDKKNIKYNTQNNFFKKKDITEEININVLCLQNKKKVRLLESANNDKILNNEKNKIVLFDNLKKNKNEIIFPKIIDKDKNKFNFNNKINNNFNSNKNKNLLNLRNNFNKFENIFKEKIMIEPFKKTANKILTINDL